MYFAVLCNYMAEVFLFQTSTVRFCDFSGPKLRDAENACIKCKKRVKCKKKTGKMRKADRIKWAGTRPKLLPSRPKTHV